MSEIFGLIGEVGAPIAGSLVMGFFIFLVIKQILEGVVDQVKTLTIFCKSLEYLQIFFFCLTVFFTKSLFFQKFSCKRVCSNS